MRARLFLVKHTPVFLLALLSSISFGEGVSRSAPETEGEKRLLEWDTSKVFVPTKSSFNGVTSTSTKHLPSNTFETRSFVSKKSVAPPSFYTPEFLSNPARDSQTSFSTSPANLKRADASNFSFNAGKKTFEGGPFFEVQKTAQIQTATPEANRSYLGPEAEKMKQKYTPETGPKGGIITGHQLTVEEVRTILNRSK
jgi:hypothetical protein